MREKKAEDNMFWQNVGLWQVCPKEIFRKMERSAQQLAMDVGYRGAGTVEYRLHAELQRCRRPESIVPSEVL